MNNLKMKKKVIKAENPQQILCKIITKYTSSICYDRSRCRNILFDCLTDYPKEKSVLILALNEGIPNSLLEYDDTIPLELLLDKLKNQLLERSAITKEFAKWCIESWALALGIINFSDCDIGEKNKEHSNTSKEEYIKIPPDDVGETTILLGIIVGTISGGIITEKIEWAMLSGFIGMIIGRIIGAIFNKTNLPVLDFSKEIAGGVTGCIVGVLIVMLTGWEVKLILWAIIGIIIGVFYGLTIKAIHKL